MNKTKLRSLLKIFLKISFTGLLLYFVVQKINFVEIKKIFQRSNPVYIFLAFVIFFLSQVASSWRLLSFFKSIGLKLSFAFNFQLYLLGMFYNIFLPGGIGGDGYKIFLLRKKFSLPFKKIFSAIFFDRLSGFWAVALAATILLFFIQQEIIAIQWAVIIFLSATIVYYLVLRKFFNEFTRNFFGNHLKALTVQGLQLITVFFILKAINFSDSYLPYLFIFLVSSVVAVIPFTIGGLGAREYVMIYAALFLDIDKNIGVYVSATFWLISAVASLPGIFYAISSQKLSSPVIVEKA